MHYKYKKWKWESSYLSSIQKIDRIFGITVFLSENDHRRAIIEYLDRISAQNAIHTRNAYISSVCMYVCVRVRANICI